MVFCSKCGKELDRGANFCLQCGVRTLKGEADGVPIPQDWLTSGLSQLGKELENALTKAAQEVERALKTTKDKIQESTQKPINCPHCGEKNPRSDAQYCYKCGKQLAR
jgi:predicted amidophosphoribosyltransferase